MCGISAIFQAGGLSSIVGNIIAMTDIICHRGPDDEGYVFLGGGINKAAVYGGEDTPADVYSSPYLYTPDRPYMGSVPDGTYCALGHRRLSILDLSPAGHQPMCFGDGRYWITYNGEVYNYLAIRQELESLGYVFTSRSDTEVIMAAYDRWGKECLHRFNGMFAFVLVDLHRQVLFAARDRFGVKPLYLWLSPGHFLSFASEIKQFTCLPEWQALQNHPRVLDFLCLGLTDHTAETLFEEVYQLKGGEALELALAELRQGRYQSFSDLPVYRWYELKPRPFTGSFGDALEAYRSLFNDSVYLRLRADVPVGSCLSGGLDSSSIVCTANSHLRSHNAGHSQKTFSACYEIERFDERTYINEVVKQTGVDAHYTYPSLDGLFANADKITWHQDEPFGSTSIYAQWMVFRSAAENGIKVMLDGQGADEQLAGYHDYFGPNMVEQLIRARPVSLQREMAALKEIHGYSYGRSYRLMLQLLIPEKARKALSSVLRGRSPGSEWVNTARHNGCPVDLRYSLKNNKSIRHLSYAQLLYSSLPMLLHWEDRNSAAHAVESRVPFVDYRLMEFALGLPNEYKLHRGLTKIILRESMREILPETVRKRVDKMGFVTPEEVWAKENGAELFRNAIMKAVEASNGILSPGALVKFEHMISGLEPFSFLFWRMISYGQWLAQFQLKA